MTPERRSPCAITTRDVAVTDAALRARLVAGDPQALAEVYRRHGSRVIAVANAVLRDHAAAEDVCHDVFLGLSRHPHRFDSGRGSLCTYLAVIAHARALDRLRSETARVRREAQQARFDRSVGPDAGDRAVASSLATQIWAAVSELPAKEAEAVRLAFFGDTTYRDVARMLDVPEGTVKSRIRSGLRHLRVEFIAQGIIPAA
jgi:RNA polymerase sigma-70 factor (ECF subfamily)